MEESTPEEKQKYLREKILDNGIEANKFIDFLKDKKGEEGADISNWTMNDLKEVVKEFYENNNIPIQSLEDNKDNIENEKNENYDNKNEENKIENQNNNNINNHDVSDKNNNILKNKMNNMIENINNENIKKS